jgi:hypothetical protein
MIDTRVPLRVEATVLRPPCGTTFSFPSSPFESL